MSDWCLDIDVILFSFFAAITAVSHIKWYKYILLNGSFFTEHKVLSISLDVYLKSVAISFAYTLYNLFMSYLSGFFFLLVFSHTALNLDWRSNLSSSRPEEEYHRFPRMLCAVMIFILWGLRNLTLI